jgi:putative DNA primase/helicase
VTDTEIASTANDNDGVEMEFDDSVNIKFVRKLLEEAKIVDFPDAPALDRKGNPRFTETDEDLRFQPLNDLGNANRLLRRYGDRLRYIENIGWHGWTGSHWSRDDGQRLAEKSAHETARAMKREVLALIAGGNLDQEPDLAFGKRVKSYRAFANSSGNASRMEAMLKTAQTYVARQHDELDTHKFRVTVENGTLNLDAGHDEDGRLLVMLEKHDPKHLISMKMPVKYDPAATCPKFEAALADIQPDPHVRQLLQAFWGYCLTGSTKEQMILMLCGGGSNGKSLLMGLMSHIFGEYSKTVPIATLLDQDKKSGSAASPDLARLPGARYVTSSEPGVGARFSENFIKIISGEEALTVRHLNEGFFEFYPQFKLTVSFNVKPNVRTADHGFWRRVALVPFEQTFAKTEEDLAKFPGAKLANLDLKEELMAELSGILNWLIEGYRIWRADGLVIPEKVRAATDEYKEESNHVLTFMRDWCDYGPGKDVSSAALYDAYTYWAKLNGVDPWSKKAFGSKVAENPSVGKARGAHTNIYKGIELNADAREAMAHKNARPDRHEDDTHDT